MFVKSWFSGPSSSQQPEERLNVTLRKGQRRPHVLIEELCLCMARNEPLPPKLLEKTQDVYGWQRMKPAARVMWLRWLMEQVTTDLARLPTGDWRGMLREAFPTDEGAWVAYDSFDSQHERLKHAQRQASLFQTQLEAKTNTIGVLQGEKNGLIKQMHETAGQLKRFKQERSDLRAERDWLLSEKDRLTTHNKRLSWVLTEDPPLRAPERRASGYAGSTRALSPPPPRNEDLEAVNDASDEEMASVHSSEAATLVHHP